MEIEITKYENPARVEGETERLQQLASLVENDSVSAIKENLAGHKKKRKSGIYAGIESDISGFFELEQTVTKSWVLCPKFKGLRRNQIKELLLKRINSVNEGTIELPERLFEVKTYRVAFEERLIDVEEVAKRTWDYILYKSTYYEGEYYVHIVFEQSAASWSKDFKLTENEAKIAKGSNDEEIAAMVEKKRNEKR